ncbi:MAG: haloacid dehalogenase type II [Acidobacteriota bacterium]
MRDLRAIAFDAYGTLFDVLSVTALCDELFPGHGHALAQLWRTKQLQYSLLGSMMHRYKDFWQITGDGLGYAANALNLTLTAGARQQLMDAYLHLSAFPDARPGLDALKKRGLPLAILSNGEPHMLQAVVASAGLSGLIDEIVSVDEVKVFKPDPRAYQLLGQKLRLATDQIAFVSSNSWDIHGAGAAGLYTVWIQRHTGEPQDELGFPAQRIVGSLTELEAIIGQGSG